MMAYIELGIMSAGDEIIVPANKFIASTMAITDNGLVPVMVDSKESNFQMDENLIKELCFKADDIWLFAMAKLYCKFSVSRNLKSNYLPLRIPNKKTLTTENVNSGHNDLQIKYVQNYFKFNFNINLFETSNYNYCD